MTGFDPDWKFTSVTECVGYLGQYFPPNETIAIELHSPSGLIVPHRAPKYLYRGECGLFETTESSLTRLERSGFLDETERECLRKIREALLWRFRREDYGNTEWNAKGLLQHYGIPTEILDFSSSLEVAAAFAISKMSTRGRICIVTKPIGVEAATIEYTNHPWAERALRQKAFGIRPVQFSDLKGDDARTRLGALWAEFPIRPEDRESRREFYDSLVDESSDPNAAMVRAEVNHYVEHFGKIPHKIAQYLTDRVPMTPRFLKVTGVDEVTREAITHHVAPSACPYSPTLERQKSLQYWSVDYSDSLLGFYPFEVPTELGTLFAYPGTYHDSDQCPCVQP